MRFYTKTKKKKITVLLSTFDVDSLLYIKVVRKHKTSLVRRSIYFREQYYAFRNQLRV